jgi:hypothetical protein
MQSFETSPKSTILSQSEYEHLQVMNEQIIKFYSC